MSFNCVTSYLEENYGDVFGYITNGEIRFLSASTPYQTDENGFAVSSFTPRTTEFIGCLWEAKTADEAKIADRVQATVVFQVQIPVKDSDKNPIAVRHGDRAELRLRKNDTVFRAVEVGAVLPVNNIFQKLIVFEIDAD